ncbi:MAG: hypothetical protein ABI969_16495 [bacterium]
MVTLEVALLVFMAFILRKNRNVHGSLLMSTALLFTGIALFFTLISHVPRYRIDLTQLVASIGRAPAFGLGLVIFLALLWMAWRVEPAKRTKHDLIQAACARPAAESVR